jgi:hypothetical protein
MSAIYKKFNWLSIKAYYASDIVLLVISQLPEPSFASIAFWQSVQLYWFSNLYGSQNTTLSTFYCFYDK